MKKVYRADQSLPSFFAGLAMSHPHRVHVKYFLSRHRSGEFPRRDVIWNGQATSIVRYVYRPNRKGEYNTPDGKIDNTVTFCFSTEEELEAFKKEYNLD